MPDRPLAFTGSTASLALAVNGMVRVLPDRGQWPWLPPIPPAGSIIPVRTVSTIVRVEVLASDRPRLEILADGVRMIATPLTPTEAVHQPSYIEGSGATDWVIRSVEA